MSTAPILQPSKETSSVASRLSNDKDRGFYIPSLDGLRAVSISIVILAHAGLGDRIPGGFGVTVFFFLSGFLITTLLRKEEVASGHISLTKFYIRRVFRILPPMYAAILLAVAAAAAGLLPGTLHFYPVLIQMLHLANYYPYLGGDVPVIPGTAVLWSLAVEEHFYLLFPMFCFILLKNLSNRTRAVILAVLCFLVLAWRFILVVKFDVVTYRTYYCTDTRIDSILFGCILGLFCNPVLDKRLDISPWVAYLLLFVSVGAILFTFVHRDPIFRETLRYSVQGVALYPIFYLAVTRHRDWMFRWLNYRPIRFLGVVSYSLYLVHHSTIIAVDHLFANGNPILNGVVGAVLAFLLATVFYHLIEKPCAKMRKKFHA